MTFGDKLKEARKAKGYTQKQLAEIIGIAESTLTGYEKGSREPDMYKIKKLMAALNVDGNYLFGNENNKIPTLIPTLKRPEPKIPEVTYAVATWKREYQEHADEYAKLDDYGREAVDAVTKVELARVKYEQEELDRVDYNNIITISKSDFAASAGTGIYLGPESFSQIKVCKNNLTKKAKFAVPVRGNSMNPDFYDGQILLVGEEQPKMGEFGIFTLDGEGYVKMLGDGILIPMNTKYPNIKMNDSIRCNGKVLGVLNPDWIVEE